MRIVLRVADRDDAPEVEHVDQVAHLHDEVHVVLDEQDRHAFGRERTQQRAELVGLLLVETRRGLVEQQHARPGRERAGDLDEPRLAGRQLVDAVVDAIARGRRAR